MADNKKDIGAGETNIDGNAPPVGNTPPAEPKKAKTRVEPVVADKTPLMTLRDYCNTLNKEGVDKYAYSRIETYCAANKISTKENKTLTEWESIYLILQTL